MMINKPFNTVVFLAREPGLILLKNMLSWSCLNINAVYTHGLKPKAEGAGLRDELVKFRELCQHHNLPLHVIDFPQTKTLEEYYPYEDQDLLVSLSWRALIPATILSKIKVKSLNIHRGLLPEYKGAEPIKQALLNRAQFGGITIHEMTHIIDEGEVLAQYKGILPRYNQQSLEFDIERIKQQYTVLYAPLLKATIEGLYHES